MNLQSFIARGTSPVVPSRVKRLDRATEQARENWISRLQSDEMRAWMDLGEGEQLGTLNGLATMLTIAGLVMAHMHNDIEQPEVRVIRSALNVVRECVDNGAVIDPVRIVTIQVACREAKSVIRSAPRASIHYASIKMNAIARGL